MPALSAPGSSADFGGWTVGHAWLAWHTALLALVLAWASGNAWAQVNAEYCGSLENAYGPVDFRTDKDKIGIVEGAHFTPKVEYLISGNASYLGGDIDYTLRAIPNHPRALVSMIRYGERLKVQRVPHARHDVECYLERALRFRPNDTTVRMLYADFLAKRKRLPEALEHLAVVGRLAGDNPFTHYNLGLVYFEMAEYAPAATQAQLAFDLGFPKTDLIDRLKAMNRWPAPAAAASAPAPAASTTP